MKKFITVVLICCLMIQFTGCFTHQLISNEELSAKPTNAGLIVRSNQQVDYGFESGSYWIDNDTLSGSGYRILENGAKVEDGTWLNINLKEVETVKVETLDATKTVIASGVVAGLGILLALGIKSLMKDATEGVANGIGRGLQGVFK